MKVVSGMIDLVVGAILGALVGAMALTYWIPRIIYELEKYEI
jgi:hypothetical protein